MQSRRYRRARVRPVPLGVASSDTLGMPFADIPEPMGFWPKSGIGQD